MVLRSLFASFVLLMLAVDCFSASVLINKRSTTEICEKQTPCGWAVYSRITRSITYFMKNNCVCSENKSCIRADDDISVAAYVYRCINKS